MLAKRAAAAGRSEHPRPSHNFKVRKLSHLFDHPGDLVLRRFNVTLPLGQKHNFQNLELLARAVAGNVTD